MLSSALLLVFCILLQASVSLQAPVKSKLPTEEASSTHQQGKPSTQPYLFDLIKSRPHTSKTKDTEKFLEGFANHPEVKRIQLDGDVFKVAGELQALRGYVVDKAWNTKLTLTVKDYLTRMKANQELTDQFNTLTFVRRRLMSRLRENNKKAARSPEEKKKFNARKENMRRERIARKEQMEAQESDKAAIVEDSFEEAMDKRLGNRQLDAIAIAEEADNLRQTHFKSETAHIRALRAYLESKNFSQKDIFLAISKKRYLKDLTYRRAKKAKTASEAGTSTVAQCPSTSSCSHSSASSHDSSSTSSSRHSPGPSPASPSSGPSLAEQPSSIDHKADKSSVDSLDDTPWWNQAGF